jgi:replicative DNA helicase
MIQSQIEGIEKIILTNLVIDSDYVSKVIPYVKEEYFLDRVEKLIFIHIKQFIEKYNASPTKEALLISIENDKKVDEDTYQQIKEIISSLIQDEVPNPDWLIQVTEDFCKEKAIYLAVSKTIKIFQGEDKDLDVGVIPKILSDAIGVTFDPRIGHSYIENSVDRFEYYHREEYRIPFDLEYFNKITSGGIVRKSLNVILAGTGVGKSLAMCHFAAANITDNKNVLYITLEMAEEKIAERIDANLFNIDISDISKLSEDLFSKKINNLKQSITGKLIIKEYPTASANVNHFRHLLNELKLRQNFVPDVVYIDYINLCTSARIKPSSNAGSYYYIKSIAEELRGLAVEQNVPIVTATQTNRGAFNASDFGLEGTSESFGLPASADLFFAMISNEELEKMNQILVKQLKNRYNDVARPRKFVIGIDRSKMRLFDLDESAQAELIKDVDESEPAKKKTSKVQSIDKSKFKGIQF